MKEHSKHFGKFDPYDPHVNSLAPDDRLVLSSSIYIQSGKDTEAVLSWLARVLSVPNLPKPILPVADTDHVTQQYVIQDGDFYFLAALTNPCDYKLTLWILLKYPYFGMSWVLK